LLDNAVWLMTQIGKRLNCCNIRTHGYSRSQTVATVIKSCRRVTKHVSRAPGGPAFCW
jgi:hypothetical protein